MKRVRARNQNSESSNSYKMLKHGANFLSNSITTLIKNRKTQRFEDCTEERMAKRPALSHIQLDSTRSSIEKLVARYKGYLTRKAFVYTVFHFYS